MSDLVFPSYVAPELKEDFIRTGFVYDVYDGDTCYYHVDLGYNIWAAFQTGRLLDCWAPEVRPLRSRADGIASRNYLRELIAQYALNRHEPEHGTRRIGHQLRIRSVEGRNKGFRNIPQPKKGKYGRWLVVLLGADDNGKTVNLNELMVRDGFATSSA